MVPRIIRLDERARQRLMGLRKAAERDGAYRVARRLHAVILNSRGLTSGEVARILESPRSKVSQWLAKFQEHGVPGLLEGHRSGRPVELSQGQQQALVDIGKGPGEGECVFAVGYAGTLYAISFRRSGVGENHARVRRIKDSESNRVAISTISSGDIRSCVGAPIFIGKCNIRRALWLRFDEKERCKLQDRRFLYRFFKCGCRYDPQKKPG
ncbi:MAG: helix-turn-helix domain-containing protein [Phycisphaerae bacterium]